MAVDDSSTVVLLHMDGADTSTTFTDESGKTWSASGNAQIDTSQSKFGGASGVFDGGGDYLSTPSNSDFSIIGQDFTLDFWMRWNTLPTSGNEQCFLTRTNNTALYNYLFFVRNTGGTYSFGIDTWNGSTAPVSFTKNSPGLSANTWYHIAFVRSGTSWYIFQDGTQCGTTTTDSDSFFDNTYSVYIGNLYGTRYLNGWMDELRLVVGEAKWTSNFTPPTAAYAPVSPVSNAYFPQAVSPYFMF